MFKILKYLKPYFILIFLIFFVSLTEVVFELALPECTRDMITNGIEQHGVNNYIPLIMDLKMKDDILILLPSEFKPLISKSYKKLISQDQLDDLYQLHNLNINSLNYKDLYILKNDDKDELKSLNDLFFNIFSIVWAKDNAEFCDVILKDTNLSSEKSLIGQFKILNDNDKNQILSIVNNNTLNIESNVLSDGIVKYICDNYNSMGLNIEKIQNNYIRQKSFKMLGYIILACISWVLIILMTSVCSAGVARNLKKDLVKSVINFSKREMDEFSVASLVTRTTNDVVQIQSFIYFTLESIFFAPLYGFIAFNRSRSINPHMSWIILLILLVMLILTLLIICIVVPKYNIIQKLVDKMNLFIRENLTGLLPIRAFNTQKFEENKFDRINKHFAKVKLFIEKVMSLIDPLIFLVVNISTVIIVAISYKYISNFTMQVGDIVVYINYTISVITSFLMLSMTIVDFPRAYVSAKRIAKVLNTNSSIVDNKNSFDFDNHVFNGEITFKNVTFKYPKADRNALENISFIAKPGQTTAIIGSTGSGKTTITNLIARLYDVTNGEILLDGINIKNISQHKLRQQISFAAQKGGLFKGTIESNIIYGNQSASQQEIEKVADVAQAINFINKKPKRFLTEISQEGTNISGGQRQRLSIARAIMKKSKVYIFDDSFSALDFNTDLALRKELATYIKDATKIIVAQRIGTILNAQQIIVLDEGKIVGLGTHKELMKNCKEYYEMALNQLPLELL